MGRKKKRKERRRKFNKLAQIRLREENWPPQKKKKRKFSFI